MPEMRGSMAKDAPRHPVSIFFVFSAGATAGIL